MKADVRVWEHDRRFIHLDLIPETEEDKEKILQFARCLPPLNTHTPRYEILRVLEAENDGVYRFTITDRTKG